MTKINKIKNKKNDDPIVIDDEDSNKTSNKIKLKINTSLQTFSGLPHENVSEFYTGLIAFLS
jgi:hypothetical protein